MVRSAYSRRTRKDKNHLKMPNELYNIICKDKKIYTHLTEEEYFNIMEDLSIEFYQTGSPKPEEIKTEMIGE